jgi:PKD repeat protein
MPGPVRRGSATPWRAGLRSGALMALVLLLATCDRSPTGPPGPDPGERPVASAGGSYAGEEGSPIQFDGSGSSGSGVLTYAWTFGDGSIGTGVTPTHTYADNGSYLVVLTVTDAAGVVSGPATAVVTVSNVAPAVSLELDVGSVRVGEDVSATGSFADPGVLDAPWQWELDWGDGTTRTGSATSASAAITGGHAYAAAGTYTVRLIVTDKDGGTGTAEVTVRVVAAPEAHAGGPYAGQEGSPIQFDGSGSSGSGVLTYAWTFGDGSTGTGVTSTHTYADDGSYLVVLTVTDTAGYSSRPDTAVVTVSNVAPAVSLELDAGSVLVGEDVSAAGSFVDPGVLDAPWQWELDWGDGTTPTGSTTNAAAAITGGHAYAAAGIYTVRLTVTDKDGGTGQAEVTVRVVAGPEADAGGPYAGQEGSPIQFDGGGSSGSGVLTYAWSFGDGSTGTGQNPTHTYADDGLYTVVLTVTDAAGVVSGPDTAVVTVSNVAPAVSLELDADSVLVGEDVSATGSFADPGVLDAPWQWELDWGDGTTETGSVSSASAAITGRHAYAAAGTYTVRLTVTDKDGGTGTAERIVRVSEPPVPAVPVRIVTFGDSNTDNGWNGRDPAVVARAYVSKVPGRLAPTDPHDPSQLAGKIEAAWAAARINPITVVNHGIGGTTTGGGGFGGPDRHGSGSPQARTQVGGITRFEAEVMGRGAPDWNGGEPVNSFYPDGAIRRSLAYVPGPTDFAYVSMGTNDPSSGLSSTQTLQNLEWMVDRWIAAGQPAAHFILTTLAPALPEHTAGFPALNAAIRTLAANKGVYLIDLAAYTSPDDGLTWKSEDLHIGDLLHYSEAVRAWIAGQVVAHMRSRIPAEGGPDS